MVSPDTGILTSHPLRLWCRKVKSERIHTLETPLHYPFSPPPPHLLIINFSQQGSKTRNKSNWWGEWGKASLSLDGSLPPPPPAEYPRLWIWAAAVNTSPTTHGRTQRSAIRSSGYNSLQRNTLRHLTCQSGGTNVYGKIVLGTQFTVWT